MQEYISKKINKYASNKKWINKHGVVWLKDGGYFRMSGPVRLLWVCDIETQIFVVIKIKPRCQRK